jgi:hypothetical protein
LTFNEKETLPMETAVLFGTLLRNSPVSNNLFFSTFSCVMSNVIGGVSNLKNNLFIKYFLNFFYILFLLSTLNEKISYIKKLRILFNQRGGNFVEGWNLVHVFHGWCFFETA